MDRVCKLELSACTPADALTITTGQRSIDQINTLAHSTVVISVQNVSHRIGSMHLCCKISLKEEGSKNMNRSNHRQNKGQVGEGFATVLQWLILTLSLHWGQAQGFSLCWQEIQSNQESKLVKILEAGSFGRAGVSTLLCNISVIWAVQTIIASNTTHCHQLGI